MHTTNRIHKKDNLNILICDKYDTKLCMCGMSERRMIQKIYNNVFIKLIYDYTKFCKII